MLQPSQHNLLTRLLNLPSKEDLVKNRIDLVEIENQIQFTDVAEELIQHFDKEVNGLEVGELVVVCVDAGAEEEARVSSVDYF